MIARGRIKELRERESHHFTYGYAQKEILLISFTRKVFRKSVCWQDFRHSTRDRKIRGKTIWDLRQKERERQSTVWFRDYNRRSTILKELTKRGQMSSCGGIVIHLCWSKPVSEGKKWHINQAMNMICPGSPNSRKEDQASICRFRFEQFPSGTFLRITSSQVPMSCQLPLGRNEGQRDQHLIIVKTDERNSERQGQGGSWRDKTVSDLESKSDSRLSQVGESAHHNWFGWQ
jgi:hypothetical protein